MICDGFPNVGGIMSNLLPVGSTFIQHGFTWMVKGYKKNEQGQMIEDVELAAPSQKSTSIVKKQRSKTNCVQIDENTSIQVSRRGEMSMSIQLAPGLNVVMGGKGTRLNVNMGPLRFSKSLKKKKH